MSNLRNCPCHVTNIFPVSIGFMSHVDLKNWPCHPVEFKGQGPSVWVGITSTEDVNVMTEWAIREE